MLHHLENYHHTKAVALHQLYSAILLHPSFISLSGVLLINPKSNTIILKAEDYNSKDF